MVLPPPEELGHLSQAHIFISSHVTFAASKRDRAWGGAS